MQTFLPYADIEKSAAVLDYRRLGKQRVETLQILNVLANPAEKRGWANHPAVRMWRGYEHALIEYGALMCQEWTENRGFKDTCRGKIESLSETFRGTSHFIQPPWIGDEAFHRSHRSNLLRKDYEFYRPQFEPDLPDDLPYVWPV